MERRLLTFIVASTAFFFFYVSMRTMFGPPPRQPPGPAQNQEVVGEITEDGAVNGLLAEGDPETLNVDRADAGDKLTVDRPDRPRWSTLGSMDPASDSWMLVTFSSRGGGLERIELTERDEYGELKYRRVDVRSGYLGYFAPQAADKIDGVLVNVVGPGTPAATAKPTSDGIDDGLRLGDVIVSIDGSPVAAPEDLTDFLAETKPRQQVVLQVARPTRQQTVDADTKTLEFNATLTQHPLDLVRLARNGGADQIEGNLSRLSCLMTLGKVNRKVIAVGQRSIAGIPNPAELIWNVERKAQDGAEQLEFVLELSGSEMDSVGGAPLRLRRTYSLEPRSYGIDMAVQVDNLGEEPQELAYRLEGVNGLTLEGWWYSNKISPNFGGAAARDVVYNTAADGHELISGFDLLKRAKNQPKEPDQSIFAADSEDSARDLKYIGVDAQYFTVAYVPPTGSETLTTFQRSTAGVVADPKQVRRHQERAVNVSFFLDSVSASVPPGASIRQELSLFAGPKVPELLAEYGLGRCVYYGWFSFFAKLLASLLHTLYAFIQNYALAIILLTVLVRAAMFPLSRKAAVNAQRMQELAPELKKIADQYKDDMEGRLKAQRELQQRVGFNPMAGCLPMFIQLPIFIGLYRALSVDIELRQAPFSSLIQWASNLAGPDMLVYWGDWLWEYLSGRGIGWLGPYFNILPVIVVVLFLLQQKMFMPPATDEQTRMTQKVMNIMTLMMGLFFFRVPAGLCIYFITSSLWGICERVLVKKTLPKGKHFDDAVIEGAVVAGSTNATKKTSTLADKIRKQISPQEEKVERPSKRRRPAGKKKR